MPISATGPTPPPEKEPTAAPATGSPTQDASSQVFQSLQPVPSYPSLKGRIKPGVPSKEQQALSAKAPDDEKKTEAAVQQTQPVKEQAKSQTTVDEK